MQNFIILEEKSGNNLSSPHMKKNSFSGSAENHGAGMSAFDSWKASFLSTREACYAIAMRPEFEASILFVLLADLLLCIAEQSSCSATETLEGAFEARIVLSSLYVMEVIIRYLAFGWKDIFGNILKSVETIIIIACLPLTIVLHTESQGLFMLHIVRFIYVFNYVSIFQVRFRGRVARKTYYTYVCMTTYYLQHHLHHCELRFQTNAFCSVVLVVCIAMCMSYVPH